MARQQESIPEHSELCPYCDTFVEIPKINEGERFRCPCCHNGIISLHKNPVLKPFIHALIALFLFICTELIPFIEINCSGVSVQMNIRETVTNLYDSDYKIISIFVYLFIQVIPLFCVLSILLINGSILFHRTNRITNFFARQFFLLKEWTMVDVFLIGIMVSLIKLYSMVDVTLLGGFFCFALFSYFYISSVSAQQKYFIWSKLKKRNKFKYDLKNIGHSGIKEHLVLCDNCHTINEEVNTKCVVCNYKIRPRKIHSLQKSLAYLIAAILLYIPSNIFPMMVTVYLGSTSYSTILEGVQFMWSTNSYTVAVIIFIASILIPVLKIAILVFLIYSIYFCKNTRLIGKTKLYRMTEFIGKWSMVDVFVVTIMSTLIQMGSLLSIYPGVGSVSFCSVVLLTMLSANSLDIRELWVEESEKINEKKAVF